jgi:hypothetical protein
MVRVFVELHDLRSESSSKNQKAEHLLNVHPGPLNKRRAVFTDHGSVRRV